MGRQSRTIYNPSAERLATKRQALKDKRYRKNHEDGNSYFSEADVRPDPYHSGDTPCCRLGLQVVGKLFPEIDGLGVVERKAEAEAGAEADQADGRDAGAAAAAASSESAEEEGGKSSSGDENSGKDNEEGQEEAPVDLMALLIRTHLLEERRQARGEDAAVAIGGNSSSSSKKKRKKKKRKKGAAAADSGADGGAATPAATSAASPSGGEGNDQATPVVSAAASLEDAEDDNQFGNDNDNDDGEAAASSSSSPSGVAQLAVSSSSSPAKGAEDKSASTPHVANGAVDADAGRDRSPLDCFLDKILQSSGGKEGPGSTSASGLPANRDLASFVDFLNARYRVYLEQEGSSGAGRRKKTDHHRTFDSIEVLPAISLRVLERQAENPACSKCREGSFTAVLSSSHEGTERLTHSFKITDESTAWPPKEGIAQLQQIEALIHSDDGIEVSQAFDYVALEEGLGGSGFVDDDGVGSSGKSGRKRFKIQLEGSVPLKSGALGDIRQYERRRPSLTRERPEFLTLIPPRIPEGESPQILSLSDIVHLVTRVLVPGTLDLANWAGGGQNDSDETNEDVFSDQAHRSLIEVGAKEYYERMTKQVKNLESLRDQIRDEEGKVQSMQENNFRPHEGKSLRKGEELCDSYLLKATLLLERFIQISLGVCSEDTPLGKWARGVVQEFADKIDLAYSESVKHVTKYQRKIGERHRNTFPGSRPNADVFGVQAVVPEYREMANKKIEATLHLHGALVEKLLSQSSIHPNLTGIQCFCAASIYYAFPEEVAVEGDKNETVQTVAESVREKRQIMCYTTWQMETSKDKLLERKRKATIVCGDELDRFEAKVDSANIEVDDVGSDAGAFTSIILRLTKYENSEDYTRVGKEETDADWFAESAEEVVGYHDRRARNLFLKWWLLRLRRFKNCHSTKQRLSELPNRYVKWTEKTFSADHSDKTEDHDLCPGYGRDRRVACLIAAMLYGWLQDRCVEWDAELRQKEVLAAMENDDQFFANDQSPTEQGSSKSSKKKKKKGKKKGGSGAAASTDAEGNVTIASTGTNFSDEDKAEDDKKNEPVVEKENAYREVRPEEPTAMASPQQQVNTDSDAMERGEKKGKLAPAQDAAVEELKPIEDQAEVQEEMEQNEETDQVALQPAYVSEVAVQNGEELIPVEYFLVRRLRAIMSQAKTNALAGPSPKKTEEKIVFL